MWATVHNGSGSPVVISDEGHSLGGGEWGPAQTTDDAVKTGVDAGTLVVVDPPEDDADVSPQARAAFAQTKEYAERAEVLSAYDKPALVKLAKSNGLVDDTADPLKSEVEVLVVRSGISIPKKSAPKSAGSGEKN